MHDDDGTEVLWAMPDLRPEQMDAWEKMIVEWGEREDVPVMLIAADHPVDIIRVPAGMLLRGFRVVEDERGRAQVCDHGELHTHKVRDAWPVKTLPGAVA